MGFTLKDWQENYEGKTEIAKTAMNSVQVINGGDYIPWAMMYRVLVELDPNATIEKVENENGGYIFYDEYVLNNYTKVVEEGKEIIKESSVPSLAFYVKVKLIFHGKEYIETMPVLASNTRRGVITKTIDTMAVHNALQRGMAKVISMATGVGLSLWTREEFAEDEKDDKVTPIPTKKDAKAVAEEKKEATKKLLEKAKEEIKKDEKPKASQKGTSPLAKQPKKEKEIKIDKEFEIEESSPKSEASTPVDEIIEIITKNRGNKALDKAFESFNIILRVKGSEIDLENDSTSQIREKLSSVNNVDALLTSLKKGVGIDD